MDPQTFYIVKGIIGVTGTVLLVVVMNRHWKKFDSTGGIGQRLRFITLFYFAVLISSASYQQVQQALQTINLRNIGALGGAILLVITSIVSLVEFHDKHKVKRGRAATND